MNDRVFKYAMSVRKTQDFIHFNDLINENEADQKCLLRGLKNIEGKKKPDN